MAGELLVRQPSAHRWKVLGAGVAANASFAAVFQGIPTAAVAMRSDYALTPAQLGVALGVIGLGMAVSEIPWGLLTDRFGDRRVLQVGLGLSVVGLAVLASPIGSPIGGHIPHFVVLDVLLFVVGLFGGSVNGASGKAIMAWFTESERGLAMSIRQTAIPLGGGVGALINLRLAESFGFEWLYAVLAAFCLVSWIAAWRWIYDPEVRDPIVDTRAAASVAGSASASPLRSLRTWSMVTAIGLLCAPQFAVITYGSVFFHDYVGVSAFVGIGALVVVQIATIGLRVWSGRWTDRRRNRREYLKACGYASGAGFLLLAALTPAANGLGAVGAVVILIAYLVAGCIVSAWHGVAFAELVSIVGHRFAGTALGMANSVVFVSLFLTPLLIPHVVQLADWPLVWLVLGLVGVIATLLFPKPHPPDPDHRRCNTLSHHTFRFDLGSPSLDFIATLGRKLTPTPEERIATAKDLDRWLIESGLIGARGRPQSMTGGDHAQFLELRTILHTVLHDEIVRGGAKKRDLESLNSYAQQLPAMALVRTRSGVVAEYDCRLDPPAIRALLAHDLITVLGGAQRHLLRQCASETCDGIYLDTSRGHNRIWCSSKACGNRARVERFRAKDAQSRAVAK